MEVSLVAQLLDFFVWCCSRCFGSFLFRVAFATPLVERFAFNGSGKSVVGPFFPGQCSTKIYMSFVIFFTVKSSREQALIHRWHFSTSCHGFGKGRNIFLPKSAISFNDLGSLSGYLESFLHCPQQQCFVVTILQRKHDFFEMKRTHSQ